MTPRLLTEHAAAEYLSIPVAGVRRIMAGRVTLDGRVRWDRVALDEWIDGLRGRAVPSVANQNGSTADEALAGWIADQKHDARRS